jgi:A/G-specific adenine glycosylase
VVSIVFGGAAAVVDGNVLRVLSRQMGVLGDVKGDKAVVGMVWEAAQGLVEAVAADGEVGEGVVSDRPGRWGQALMELGSTVCTPKPRCEVCPVTGTCRVYEEGLALAKGRREEQVMGDIEDACTLCAPLEEVEEDEGGKPEEGVEKETTTGERRVSRFFVSQQAATPTIKSAGPDIRTLDIIVQHARKFPLRKPKKKVREEEAVVCAIRRSSDGRYLIHRRPAKGLLAGLWELPSHTLPETNSGTTKTRKLKSVSYVAGLVGGESGKRGRAQGSSSKHLAELGSVPWLFSHLKLTMHVQVFELDDVGGLPEVGARERWASAEDIDNESMGTGMKKCWTLVKEHAEQGLE